VDLGLVGEVTGVADQIQPVGRRKIPAVSTVAPEVDD
jgi:hypothetical protein